MIQASNDVLDKALDPYRYPAFPRGIFQRCVGIVVLPWIYEAGLVFSGVNGTGVVVAKKEDGTWSNPSAVELLGVNFGPIAGFQKKDVIIFITDKNTMHALSGQGQAKLGGRAGATSLDGREADASLFAGKDGVGGAFAFSLTERGFFCGLSLDGSYLKPLNYANHKFYEENMSPGEILCLDSNETQNPADDNSAHFNASQNLKTSRGALEISNLHTKLRHLAAGHIILHDMVPDDNE